VENREVSAESIGEQLGFESVGSVVSKVEAYCAYEEQRIELTNQPRIVALSQEGALLLEEERDLTERLQHAPPLGDIRSRRRRAAYYWGIAIVLTFAAFVFSLLSFEPFRIGWKGYLYCLGIAIVTPFWIEQLIEKRSAGPFLKVLAATACAAALTSLVLLAVIRGDLFAEQMKSTAPVIVFDDAPSQTQSQPQPQSNFYDATVVLLRLVMALLAVAMELGAGLALHEAWRMGSDSPEDWEKFRNRLAVVRERMVAITYEITVLQNEPRVFATRFWRNFYRAMLTHSIRNAMTKLLTIVIVAHVLLFPHRRAFAQEHTNLVVAVDLTQSVAVAGPDGKTEFQKNNDAVTKLLAQIPANSQLTVIGITDRSFAQPDILLSAKISGDIGYFGERLVVARAELVRVWKARSARLKPEFRHTDIVGALFVASQIFNEKKDAEKKLLIIFSDMRQSTEDLDFDSRPMPPSFLTNGNRAHIVRVDIRGVRVYALGVDGAGKQISYWQGLRQFWKEYFQATGADFCEFSTLRDVSEVR
jgi:hypothetical protein